MNKLPRIRIELSRREAEALENYLKTSSPDKDFWDNEAINSVIHRIDEKIGSIQE